jgi:hypothetical protein
MCKTPIRIDENTLAACRNCWQCRLNRVNDLVGRCIAESKTATETLAVTLTYSNDAANGASPAVLVYDDFQRFMKRLRKRYTVRYIVAGEYGSKRGRAHWHAILFFYGKAPKRLTGEHFGGWHKDEWDRNWLAQDKDAYNIGSQQPWKVWGHGHVLFQKPDYGGFAYVLKYVLKDTGARSTHSHLAMSKKPLLGFHYITELARRHVKEGLAPRSYEYAFDDVFNEKTGKRRKFWLRGRAQDLFLETFFDAWREERPDREVPHSELLSEAVDNWFSEAEETEELEQAYLSSLDRRIMAKVLKEAKGLDSEATQDHPDPVDDWVYEWGGDYVRVITHEAWSVGIGGSVHHAPERIQIIEQNGETKWLEEHEKQAALAEMRPATMRIDEMVRRIISNAQRAANESLSEELNAFARQGCALPEPLIRGAEPLHQMSESEYAIAL